MQKTFVNSLTSLAQGNEAFRNKKFAQAIFCYGKIMVKQPELIKSIALNLTLARKKYRVSRLNCAKPQVAICGWELAHNAADRVHTLATIYETFADTEIIGCILPSFGHEIWEPIRDTAIKKNTIILDDESKFIEQAITLVAAHPYDIIHLSKPRAPNIFLGVLYKLFWDSKVIMDIDDEELVFVDTKNSISIDEYIQQHGKLPGLNDLAGKDWTRIAVGLAKEFDDVTVSNTALQQRYGGSIIRNASDEKLYKPLAKLKQESREKFDIPVDAKVVLFFGTPLEHKGLIEAAHAISSLKRPDIIYCIADSFMDRSFKRQLLEVKGCKYKFLPNQPISKASEVLAIADCCVFLHDINSTAAQYQTPAKLSDALAMGVPVLLTKLKSTEDLYGQIGIKLATPGNISEQLEEFIQEIADHKYSAVGIIEEFKKTLSIKVQAEALKHINVDEYSKTNISKKLSWIVDIVGFPYRNQDATSITDLMPQRKKLSNATTSVIHNIILAENPLHPPDFFALRASEQLADSLAIMWLSSLADLKCLSNLIRNIDQEFELLILTARDFADQIKLTSLSSCCKRLTIIGFPNKTKRSGSFVRVINSGALWRYRSLILLDCDKSKAQSNIYSINNSIKLLNEGFETTIGLISCEQQLKTDFTSKFSKKYLGAWYARLHRELPKKSFFIPRGTTVVRTVIVHQISGLDLKAYEFDNLDKQNDENAFDTLLYVLGAFTVEGVFKSITFDELEKNFLVKHASQSERIIKTIAFYLPQFHVIPENDCWWGKGFTEWNNVVRAKPLFRSHYQPMLPADLGFYDLRSNTTQIAQADLAKKFGIHGFCYYYYYFNGKKLLNEPIEQMLAEGKPDFPFCICWANENWSRNWDGQNRHVLMEQNYSNESNKALIHEFIHMMKDKRYIRHHGKPVLLVYRIKIIPNWLEVAAMWREECRRAGVGEIHLCSIRFGLEPLEGMPAQHGLDAYVLFPPQDMDFVDVRSKVHDLHSEFSGTLLSYDAVVDGDIARFKHGYSWPVHRGAMLSWDNTARRLTAARIFTGCTPMRYRAWLSQIVRQEEEHNPDKDSLLFINAWNEWAEGTTLEPNQRYGTAYLEATRSVIAPFVKNQVLNKNIDSSVIPISGPIFPKRYLKELTVPKLPERFQGKAEFKPSAPTVLLCAHISGHQLFGGERSFLDVLEALYRLELNIVVTLPSSNNKAYVNHIAKSAIAIYLLPYKQWIAAREPDPMVQLQFCDLIAAHNVSIVYSNTIVLIEPALAARRMNRLSVVHARELISIDDSLRERIGLPVQTIIKTVYERYDFVIANSKATEFTFAREGRTFYAPNSVDAKELALENKLGKRIKIGIVSSNIPKKGISDFIEVAKLCKDLIEKVEFVVIGPENAQVQQWKKAIETGLLPANLKFLGYRETPKTAMAELNILLNLSSFAESFGRTVAEAMAAKRPVIAYQWGALPELVQHEVNGYMVPYGDIRKVADYVRVLCGNPGLIEKMGQAGQVAVAQKFSHEVLFKHLETAITEIRKSPDWQILHTTELKTAGGGSPVTVIIPVYNAANEVKNCIDSVLRHTPLHDVEIVIINDGSTDHQIAGVFKNYSDKVGVRILQNDKNIGYTKTVNRGIKEAGVRDVVLLNSDTIVTPTWLNALRASAYSKPKIGTVTAMSDNAGAFSFPKQGVANPKPEDMSHDDYAMRVIDQTLDYSFPEVPTGSGFCMYIRRDLINQIGAFDEVLFPRGYGEENDFCMRALNAGWKNVVTSWTFVFHIRTASFKGEKDALVKAGVDVVMKRYPSYVSKVKEAFASPEMTALRTGTNIKLCE